MEKISAVIVAGGCSSRMGGTDKLRLVLGGKTVLRRAAEAFAQSACIAEIVVVAAPDRVGAVQRELADLAKLRAVVPGGATRALSVRAGVLACAPDAAYYAIHDAARPFVSAALIERTAAAAAACGAAAPALPVTDTVKVVDGQENVEKTLERSRLRAVSTPQIFRAALYRQALELHNDGAFDDCQLVEQLGCPVRLVPGESDNFKITAPQDILRAKQFLGETSMRIGHGYDVHKLVEGRKLILGGVEIPWGKGLLGHSDADVLLHAVADALLGAAALGDIGALFPDSDPAYEGADSRALLREVVRRVNEAGWAVGNIDATVLAQAPKLRPHIDAMRANIAADCGVAAGAVSVKATTEEGLGFTGDGSGIAAHAVALLSGRMPEKESGK